MLHDRKIAEEVMNYNLQVVSEQTRSAHSSKKEKIINNNKLLTKIIAKKIFESIKAGTKSGL